MGWFLAALYVGITRRPRSTGSAGTVLLVVVGVVWVVAALVQLAEAVWPW